MSIRTLPEVEAWLKEKAKNIADKKYQPGWIDDKGLKQGRWKSSNPTTFCDYKNGIIFASKTIFSDDYLLLCFTSNKNKEVLHCDYNFKVKIYSLTTIGENQTCLNGWNYQAGNDYLKIATFYYQNRKIVDLLDAEDRSIQKICLLQRLWRRRLFNRQILLFQKLKFLPLEIFLIINDY